MKDQQGVQQSSPEDKQPYVSWAERNGFSDWALALFWIVVAFFLFQVTASVVAIVLVGMESGISSDPSEMMGAMTEHLDLVFVGNSLGQIMFLGLATWFYARLHTSRDAHKSFMRFTVQDDTLKYALLSVFIVVAGQPVIWFLSWLNALIPVPESFTNMQSTQMEMIENFLKGDHDMWLTLFHVAIVPAICEEVLYRSYVMRAFEKSWGIWPAIIISGLLFGLYHIQLTNLLPLATLGMLFAYITWVSRSILPAMAAHFANNGGSVFVGTYYPESAFAEMTPESMPSIWAVIISLVITAYIVYWMYNQYQQKMREEAHYV
ncbi:CPBP family intramembrane glutamic endopeptidase [Fodinibius sediminis]|uniref:CAAX prenyl protease 2/Lysostaphin resistance protein A-like domain-containing protein n=1 Tax=Fodinibius sediminis TaxID=1214077 RepID=A0A521F4B2_9BACT|nr:CPBP family intramembrane glutamic endopeptidase [Fodinibius sediminis]SMO91015.1 hypothetical protein SAMN06265218_1237 [Fodinibius sediminis]